MSDQPRGYNLGRDVNVFPDSISLSVLSDPIRNFTIQQNGNNFYFRRWLSSQNNFNLFPFIIGSINNTRYTTISNPTFNLDTGEYFDNTGEYLYTWIYLKSTLTSNNDDLLFYKTNCTGYGTLDKAALDPNYTFHKLGIDQAVEIGDYIYMSYNNNTTGESFFYNIVCRWVNWFGSFFRVTDNTIQNQITLVIDNTIFPTLYPSALANNFIKEYPNADPGFLGYPAMIYDLGYCFQRPGATTYERPIAITVNEGLFPNSHENNGIVATYDNFNYLAPVDTLAAAPHIRFFVMSYNLPICRSAKFKLVSNIPLLNLPDEQQYYLSPLGSQNINGLLPPQFGILYSFYQPTNMTAMTQIFDLQTRGFPIFFYTLVNSIASIDSVNIEPISADYLLGRI